MKWLFSKQTLTLLLIALGTIAVVNRTALSGIIKRKA